MRKIIEQKKEGEKREKGIKRKRERERPNVMSVFGIKEM